MKNVKMKVAVFGVLGLASAQAFAAGTFINLPTGGFAAVGADPASAYTRCYADGRVIPPLAGPATTALLARGNFGMVATAGSSGRCEITGIANDATAPLPGYGAQITSTTQAIRNAANTADVGSVTERVWRKLAATAPVTATNMCIIGTKVTLNSTLYDTTRLEVNDVARGGYTGKTVNVGYKASASESVVNRAGRAFTSAQHRAYIYGGGTTAQKQNNGTGYVDIPPIGGVGPEINGINTALAANVVAPAASTATQQVLVNNNWVDFTVDIAAVDDDGGNNPVSAMMYVEFDCGTNTDNATIINTLAPNGSTAGWRRTGAIKIRRTAQENTTFATITMPGYAPSGSTVP